MRRLATLLTLGLLATGSAHAAMTMCNRTSYILDTAAAAQGNSLIASQGWSRIVPGACSIVVAGNLTADAYFVYARSSQAHRGQQRSWGGSQNICVKDTNFSIGSQSGSGRCGGDGEYELPFAILDTKRLANWTMTFSETPRLDTLLVARLAGIERLLDDVGYRLSIDGRPSLTQQRVLADFSRRMHVLKSSGDAGLFDALETAALKNAVPQGYSVCNDAAKPLLAALGHKDLTSWQSHGWWQIAPGTCARLITTPLQTDAYYLYVQRIGGAPVVKGDEIFCTTGIEFDIQGRTRCNARGLIASPFLKTPVAGIAGYAAHVAENGLVPAQSGTSK